MEFWYFLILMSGGWLIIRGLFKKKTNGLIRFGTFVIGGLLIILGLFMLCIAKYICFKMAVLRICLKYGEEKIEKLILWQFLFEMKMSRT